MDAATMLEAATRLSNVIAEKYSDNPHRALKLWRDACTKLLLTQWRTQDAQDGYQIARLAERRLVSMGVINLRGEPRL